MVVVRSEGILLTAALRGKPRPGIPPPGSHPRGVCGGGGAAAGPSASRRPSVAAVAAAALRRHGAAASGAPGRT